MSAVPLTGADALLISTRDRQVWTTDEKKLVNRAAKLFNSYGVRMVLECQHATCPAQRIVMTRDPHDPGGMILACGCTNRVFVPAD